MTTAAPGAISSRVTMPRRHQALGGRSILPATVERFKQEQRDTDVPEPDEHSMELRLIGN